MIIIYSTDHIPEKYICHNLIHYSSHNLATTKVSKSKLIFVASTQTIEHVTILNL